MAAFEFNYDAAMSADRGGFITEGGVGVGVITKAKSFKTDGGAGGVEFSIEDSQGKKADFIRVYTKNKDGTDNFAKGKISALMGLLGLQSVEAVPDKQEAGVFHFPKFLAKPIGFMLQREDYTKADKSIGWKIELLHWLKADTLQIYSEWKDGKPADTSKQKIEDKRIAQGAKGAHAAAADFDMPPDTSAQDDLPF